MKRFALNFGWLRERRAVTLFLRGSYIVSLLLIGVICAYFFQQQRIQSKTIHDIGALGEQFAVLDVQLADLAYQAERAAATLPATTPEAGTMMSGMTMAQRKEYRANLPIDPAILALKTAVLYRLENSRLAYQELLASWERAPRSLKSQIANSTPYLGTSDPFQHHALLIDKQRVEAARSKFDMHWTAREIFSLYDSNVAVSNRQAQIVIRSYLEKLSAHQARTLQQFLKITMAALLGLLFFVFIPLDIALQRMVSKLSLKTIEADRALIKAKAPTGRSRNSSPI
jgi:hypothetical protein